MTAVWTGRLLVMWGGFGEVGDTGRGWMYRPPD